MCLVLSFRRRRNDKLAKFPFIRNSLVQVTDSHIFLFPIISSKGGGRQHIIIK
jgi:hypothetical protein